MNDYLANIIEVVDTMPEPSRSSCHSARLRNDLSTNNGFVRVSLVPEQRTRSRMNLPRT